LNRFEGNAGTRGWLAAAREGCIPLVARLFGFKVLLIVRDGGGAGKGGIDVFIVDGAQVEIVNVGGWFLLDNLLEDTVVKMLVKVLGVGKVKTTSGTLSDS